MTHENNLQHLACLSQWQRDGLQTLNTEVSPDTRIRPVTGELSTSLWSLVKLNPGQDFLLFTPSQTSPRLPSAHPPSHLQVWWPPRGSSHSEASPCYSCSWWTQSVCLGLGRWPLPRRRPRRCPRSASARCLRAGRAWRRLGVGTGEEGVCRAGVSKGFLQEPRGRLEGWVGESLGRDSLPPATCLDLPFQLGLAPKLPLLGCLP